MAVSTGIPKGTRDFSPEEMIRRNLIFDAIKNIFDRYGYACIETPAMENLSTLTGKYGEEGDRLIFKILNSGDFLAEAPLQDPSLTSARLAPMIAEKALRYDLTVPFARYVVQHRSEIQFPFRRYQIQPVWRADRPQKGRYREFFQCDVDIIGSNSLLCEAELVQIMDDVFGQLGIQVCIHVNNRKVLTGIAETIGHPDKFTDLTVAIDKLEKIGHEAVKQELLARGFDVTAADTVLEMVTSNGSTGEKRSALKKLLSGSPAGLKGMDEIDSMFAYLSNSNIKAEVIFNPALARGLNYYTGAIFEVKALDVNYGSICGGGRYDDLTGIFGLPDVSGVGVSFGADRIYDVMNELKLFPESSATKTRAMFINFGGQEELYSLHMLEKLRKAGINAEIYPDAVKIKKQFSHADSRGIPCVIMTGSDEMNKGTISWKNMKTGEQLTGTVEQFIEIFNA